MPTGAGKSLTYQLPALVGEGLTLVVSPLIALMKDQTDTLQPKGIAAAALNSSLEAAAQRRVLREISRLELLYLAPGRLGDSAFLEALSGVEIARLIVDEAHCISAWGHDFRPDYRTLGAFRERLGGPPITALTATATPDVREDIIRSLGLRDPTIVTTGFDRPNLVYRVHHVKDEEKRAVLERFLGEHQGAGLVYVGTRQEAERLSLEIAGWGYACAAYHGGRSTKERSKVQDALLADRLRVVVATNAFGMGIDKPNLRWVLHYRLPGSLKAYYQEAGRAGRDGERAVCALLHDPEDVDLQAHFIESASPTLLDLKRIYLYLRHVEPMSLNTPNALEGVAEALELSRNRVFRSLQELQNQGTVTLSGEERKPRPSLQPPFDRKVPTFNMTNLEVHKRSRYDLLARMVAYARSDGCRRQFLMTYFGEHRARPVGCLCDGCSSPRSKGRGAEDSLRYRTPLVDW